MKRKKTVNINFTTYKNYIQNRYRKFQGSEKHKKKLDSKTFFLDGDETSNKITTTNKKK